MKDRELEILKKDIQKYFKYLFDRGYTFSNVIKLSMGDWMIFLQSPNNSVVISSDEKIFDLGFGPKNATDSNFIGISGIIYFLTNKEVKVGLIQHGQNKNRDERFIELSKLVEQYHDQIIPYFGDDYWLYKLDLSKAGKDYTRLMIDTYWNKK